MTFAMAVPRRPPSSNKNRNAKFQTNLAADAKLALRGASMLDGPLYIRLAWFHSRPTTQDVDSIFKNVLDSLKGVVFVDDILITQCLGSRIDVSGGYEIIETDAPSEALAMLHRLLGENHDDILYVEVGLLTISRVAFGPIDA